MENEWEFPGIQPPYGVHSKERGLPEWPLLMASGLTVHQDPITSTCSFTTCLENPACGKETSATQSWVDTFNNCFFCFLHLMRYFLGAVPKMGVLLGFRKNDSVFYNVVLFPYKNLKNSTQ